MRTKAPTRDQVRVWLDTVLVPIADALRVERVHAERENWSFRCHSRDFEFLWHTGDMVSPRHLLNLEQLWQRHADVKALSTGHNDGLARLREACRSAFDATIGDGGFGDLARRAGAEDSDLRYLAEHIVNGAEELPHHYSLRDRWESHGRDLLALRQTPSLEDLYAEVRANGSAFREAVLDLSNAVMPMIITLADAHGLAPVDPVRSAVV